MILPIVWTLGSIATLGTTLYLGDVVHAFIKPTPAKPTGATRV